MIDEFEADDGDERAEEVLGLAGDLERVRQAHDYDKASDPSKRSAS